MQLRKFNQRKHERHWFAVILEVIETWVLTPRFKKKGKRRRTVVARCDVCEKIFERGFPLLSKFHFCSPKCDAEARTKGSFLYKQIIETNFERYDAIFWSASKEGKAQIEQTTFERYGVRVSSQWFHDLHPNDSQLWTRDVLKTNGVL